MTKEEQFELRKEACGGIVYLFFRAEVGFYPLLLQSDEEAIANAECNPGTTKVENAFTSEVVWEPK